MNLKSNIGSFFAGCFNRPASPFPTWSVTERKNGTFEFDNSAQVHLRSIQDTLDLDHLLSLNSIGPFVITENINLNLCHVKEMVRSWNLLVGNLNLTLDFV